MEKETMKDLADKRYWVRSKCEKCGKESFSAAATKVKKFPKITDLTLEQIMAEYPCKHCRTDNSIELTYEMYDPNLGEIHKQRSIDQQKDDLAKEKVSKTNYQPPLPKTKNQNTPGFTKNEITKVDWSNT